MDYNEVLETARTKIGTKCKACRKKQHHQQINHQVHFLSRIPLYLCTLVCRQILYLRQQAKVNTPNTAKLKQALKVAAVIYLHLSLS